MRAEFNSQFIIRSVMDEIEVKPRAGSLKLFCHWFGSDGGRIYRRFVREFDATGKGWAHSEENLRQNVMSWSGFRDKRSTFVSSGNDSPPPGNWVDVCEHLTAVLHVGFLRFLPVLVQPTDETVPSSLSRSRLVKESEWIDPEPIDRVAARVAVKRKEAKDGR